MSGEITRREFLKETISNTTILSLGSVGFGLGEEFKFKETVQCKNCGSVNIFIRPYFSSLIFPKDPLYCYDCGINLNTLKLDIIYDNSCHGCKKKIIDKNRFEFPDCCQIPFPNHKYLKKTRKPNFSINDIKF